MHFQDEKRLSSLISRILSKDPLLASLVTAFLAYVQDGGYAAEEGFLVTLACKKLEIVIVCVAPKQGHRSSGRLISIRGGRHARKILLSDKSGWLIPVLRSLAAGLVTLAFAVGQKPRAYSAFTC